MPKASVVDAGAGLLNLTTTYSYDVYGNLRVVNGPRTDVVDTVTTVYDSERRPVQVIDAQNKSTVLRYNHDGRLVLTAAQISTQWSVSCQNYLPSGKPKTAWGLDLLASNTACPTAAALVPVTSYGYDALDRQSRTVTLLPPAEGGNRITDTLYFPDGQVQAVKSGVGTPLAQDTATYTYTPKGLPKTVKDAEGNMTTYVYDGHDRKFRTRYPDKAIANQSSTTNYEEYQYDNNGNVTQHRQRDGQIVTFGYDNLDRLLPDAYPNASENLTYTYDLLGRRKSAVKVGSGTAYLYDHAGRVKIATANGRTLNYLYDAAGNRTRLTWPEDGFFVSTQYDALNRPVAIKAVRRNN